MSYVIPFRGLRPSPRSDGIKWITAIIQEAADSNGNPVLPFVNVESFPISDYADAANPPIINLTTDQATQLPGWYRVEFIDSGVGIEYTAPRLFSTDSIRPSTRDVAVYIKNRTVDENNTYIGDFTSTTVVTADEVEDLIGKAEQAVLRPLDVDPNVPIPMESQQAISDAIALYAAMLVELTKFSEQIQTNRSPYTHLRDLFEKRAVELLTDVRGIAPTSSSGRSLSVWDLVATQFNLAQYTFPEIPNAVNWMTKF